MNITAKRIKEILDRYNISQRQLADRVGVTEAAISKYITSDRIPRADILGKIAVSLGVTTDYLLGNSNIPNKLNEQNIEKVINEVIKLLDTPQDFYLYGIPLDKYDIKFIKCSLHNTIEYVRAVMCDKYIYSILSTII